MRLTLLLLPVLACFSCTDPALAPSKDDAKTLIPASLRERSATMPITTHASNVIVFIGDGMGVSTVTAGRIFAGQQLGVDGESYSLAFESLPYTAMVKTYNTNQQVPDSAGTASAIFSGVKTRAGVLSVGPQAQRQDCEGALAHPLTTVWEQAEARGLATGIVTSTRLTHATPAALYAHSPERNWEDDSSVPPSAVAAGCRDIAAQLLAPAQGDGPEVMLGGGRANFLPTASGGRRRDGRDLLATWAAADDQRSVIHTRDELLAAGDEGQLLGVFADSHLPYEQSRDADTTVPSLREMTEAALDRLSGAEDGYLLMVEGGRIDHGHHEGIAGRALSELVAFDEAIAATLARVDLRETLVLVTADHSHVFTMAGYPTRNNPILGLVIGNDASGNPLEVPAVDAEGTAYTTLGYLNGPGAVSGVRPVPQTGPEAVQHALISTHYIDAHGEKVYSETHGGEDVALYAGGPWAHLARGVMEQNLIHDLIVLAYGWSPSP